jgi:hypothetical protein
MYCIHFVLSLEYLYDLILSSTKIYTTQIYAQNKFQHMQRKLAFQNYMQALAI